MQVNITLRLRLLRQVYFGKFTSTSSLRQAQCATAHRSVPQHVAVGGDFCFGKIRWLDTVFRSLRCAERLVEVSLSKGRFILHFVNPSLRHPSTTLTSAGSLWQAYFDSAQHTTHYSLSITHSSSSILHSYITHTQWHPFSHTGHE